VRYSREIRLEIKRERERVKTMASKKSAIVLPGSKVLKHIVFVRFNDGITDEQIEKFIKDYAHVADVVEPVKGFGW